MRTFKLGIFPDSIENSLSLSLPPNYFAQTIPGRDLQVHFYRAGPDMSSGYCFSMNRTGKNDYNTVNGHVLDL